MSSPAMYRLFRLTAISDKENTKKFSFGQASALAEHILRAVFHVTTDKVRPQTFKDSNVEAFFVPWCTKPVMPKEPIVNTEP